MERILHYPRGSLLEKSSPATAFDGDLARLALALNRLLLKSGGLGLAAPQIGVNVRMFSLRNPGGKNLPITAINPRIIMADGEELKEEGCLSLPSVWVKIPRPAKAAFEAQDTIGRWFSMEVEGKFARALMHEIDHLDGVLVWDHLPDGEREKAIKSYLEGEKPVRIPLP